MSHRFQGIDIHAITLENYLELLPKSLAAQVEDFLPPAGSFDSGCLVRYLENIKNY
jgi:hypothetical protein